MKLRCYLLSLLRIHHPDCKHCFARTRYGMEMRKRLEELGWRVQPCSPEVHSQPGEVITLPVSFKAQRGKKTA
jgi:hypothetical protein